MDDFNEADGMKEPRQTHELGRGPKCGAASPGGPAEGALSASFYRFDAAEVELPGAADAFWPLDSLLLNRSGAFGD
jgi:hypothetical protein